MGVTSRQSLVKIGERFIAMTELHGFLATSVMETLPLNMNDLFSQQAKDMARAGSVGQPRSPSMELSFFETIAKSPWKVCSQIFYNIFSIHNEITRFCNNQ